MCAKRGGDGIDCRIENLHRNEFQGEYDYMMMEKPQAPSRERERGQERKKNSYQGLSRLRVPTNKRSFYNSTQV
jgi:hypothetical protein